ncbi:MAG TPA: transcription termination/antitermination NusG family protein [Candidatus Cybelea sp.]|jgi:transcriptional antiterminator RfaH|nr:transcription termination/antitermination NusG family protein [Candidatus Cybelea sp.]
MQLPKPAWYCARTKPKHEHIAAANVGKRLGLKVFHPRLRLERATRRGVVRVVEPLFPCYIFVYCILENCLDELRHVTGISNLVHFGHKIPAVPETAIVELQQCFESEQPMIVEDGVIPGAEVKIAEGVFMGFSGMVVRALSAGLRVQILLDFLGRITLAEVDRKSLRVENRRVADILPLLATPGSSDPAMAG